MSVSHPPQPPEGVGTHDRAPLLPSPLEVILFSTCLVLILALLGLALYEGYYLQRIYPGVQALNVPLGGLSPSQAVVALPRTVDPYLAAPLRLRYGDQVWEVRAAQLGVRFDRPTMVRLAYGIGREQGLRANLWQQWVALQVGYRVAYQLAFNEEAADRFLADLARQIDRPARDAALTLQGLAVDVQPSQVGRELDIAASRARIFARLSDLTGGEVELVVHEIPPKLADVSQAAQQVRCLLSSPVVLKLPDDALTPTSLPTLGEGGRATPGPWMISPEMLASALRIERDAGSATDLVVRVEREALRPRMELLAKEVDVPPVDARLEYDPAADTFTELTPSRRGQRLDVDAALERVLAAVDAPSCVSPQASSKPSGGAEGRVITLPLIPQEPTVSAAKARELGIRELVAEGITAFKRSSQARIKNIATAASRFHGVVVGPGEVFSFNRYLGEVSAETGYEESLIIMGDRTQVGIGGGVCQVATTAFRAAFWGGYPIEERWAHGYRVRAYEPPVGLDATVYAPQVDFKFRNDTPYYLLIQTETDLEARTVAFRFYSTSTGRRVEMEGPKIENHVPHGPDIIEEDPTLPVGTRKQVDWAVDGLDATVIRRVYEGDELVREEVFFSRYRPWQARFRVGTKPPED